MINREQISTMEDGGTDSLRAMARKWSLAGDDQLLNLLQNTHQGIISKCQDVNSKLEEMASALDDATINLQNVNNKFMALSNSQFIESRVYDDEEDLAAETQPVKEPPQPSPTDEVSMLKSSLSVLERAHETAEIIDDSDSDSDTEISVVLKPKDMYPHRPLPYIIGSPHWKSKWHAGLIVEDSDTDSSTSKREDRDIEQFSDSESEVEERPAPPILEGHTISETSSSFNSSQALNDTNSQTVENTPPARQRPADIAAELARRLGGTAQVAQTVEEREEYTPPVQTTRKVYKPEQPATSNIFLDEPPPLDSYEPEDTQSEDDDIFAEINKNKPYTQRNTAQNNLTADLFRFDKPVEQGDIFSDFAPGQVETKPAAKQKSTLFEDESEPELFAKQPPKKEVIRNNVNVEKQETSTKKPVGGISPFGSNKGAESIGAAILKRNRRKSSTSGDESGSDHIKKQNIDDKPRIETISIEKTVTIAKSKTVEEANRTLPMKQKDIFDNLFAKSEKVTEKKPAQKIIKEPVKENTSVKVKESNFKDLFSDNIFDDIDDIFTSNVKIPSKDQNQKSIFDDDDDLFCDIAKPKSTNQPTTSKHNQKTSSEDKKSIFESDDDLFSDVKTVTDKTSTKIKESHNTKPVMHDKTDVRKASNDNNIVESVDKVENKVNSTETTKERNLFDDSPQNVQKSKKPPVKSKGIFDSDSDEDIFAHIKISDDNKSNKTENVLSSNINENKPMDNAFKTDSKPKLLATENVKSEDKSKVFQSPSLFEENEIDDLFINSNKLDSVPVEPRDTKIAEVKHIPSVEKDAVIEKDTTNTVNETNSYARNKGINNLPKSFDEPDLKVTEKSIAIPSQEIAVTFDDNLLQDDLFSSSKKTLKFMPNQNTAEEVLKSEVVEANQEASDLTAEEAKGVSYAETLKTESQLDDTERLDDKKTETDIETQDPKQQDAKQSVFDDFVEHIKEKEALTGQQKKPILDEPDIFDDLLTEPPDFEKPSEPKKSKNVNALFDDDSDDESLFFKKNDVISDEKPEIFSSTNANFDIFISEPPAIDVDFTTKSTKNVDDDDDIFSFVPKMEIGVTAIKKLDLGDNDKDLFNYMPKIQESVPDSIVTETEVVKIESETHKISNEVSDNAETDKPEEDKQSSTDTFKAEQKIGIESGDSDDDFFSSFSKPNVPQSSRIDDIPEQKKTMNASIDEKKKPADEFDDIFNSKESPSKETETKKIGKLNTKNFNINVNALMPGASPKKVPKEVKEQSSNKGPENNEITPKMVKLFPTSDEIDHFEPKSLSNTNEYDEKDSNKAEIEPKGAKSKTFEEKPESEVLDNKASKQRAKIQVKRRPSTRRARHEAVRRSAIDFGDDTDNSNSFDEPDKSRLVKSIKASKEKTDSQSPEIKKEIVNDDQKKHKANETQKEVISTQTEVQTSAFENVDSLLPSNSQRDNKDYQNKVPSSEINTETRPVKQTVNERKGTTTKVVYILNDEDIFNTGSKNVETESENDLFGHKRIETKSDDDIFKSMDGVNTLGKTYKENTRETTEVLKKYEIMNTKEAKTSQIAKTALFDDSDEELFNKTKKVVKKTNIFDSDSEEDLFSGKKRTEKQNKEEKNREVKERKVVNVKGSLFGDDDDDDDLFGVKKEKSEPKQPSSKPSTSKETSSSMSSKSAELVFDDPLSMLGDD